MSTEQAFPLTPAQISALVESLSGPPDLLSSQVQCELRADFDSDVLGEAWRILVAGTDALRAAIRHSGVSTPYQVVSRSTATRLETIEARDNAEAMELLDHNRRVPFDLESPPLARLVMITTPNQRHVGLTTHHLLIDGISARLLLSDLLRIAEELADGHQPVADSPSFFGYVSWQARLDRSEADRYLIDALAGADGAGQFGARSRGPGDRRLFRLSAGQNLRVIARRAGVTVAAVIHDAWAEAIRRRTGQDDVVHGVVIAQRHASLPGVGQMVGMMTAALPLRTRRGTDPVARVRSVHHDLVRLWSDPGLTLSAALRAHRAAATFASRLTVQPSNAVEPIVSPSGRSCLVITDIVDRVATPVSIIVVPGSELLMSATTGEDGLAPDDVTRTLDEFTQLLTGAMPATAVS